MDEVPFSVFDDLDSLKLTSEDLAAIAAARLDKAPKRHRNELFVRGPFQLQQLLAVAGLPGKALAVWLLVHHQVRMTRKAEVTLPAMLLTTANIDRYAKMRALRDLERMRLIHVRRMPGQMPRISLAKLPCEGEAQTGRKMQCD